MVVRRKSCVGRLQRLDAFGVRPDHEIGVGPQARHVVETAHHDAALLLLLEEGRGVVDDGLPPLRRAKCAGPHREHREHQVANGGVERVVVQSGHENYRATGVSTARIAPVDRSAGRGDARRHPDPVEIAAGHRQRRRQAGAQLGDQVAMAGPVLRHRVEPALHADVDRVDGPARKPSPGPVPPTPAARRRTRWPASSSPNRPNDSRSSSTSVRRPHFRDDNVIALARNRSPLATSTPEFCGKRMPPGTASATTTDDALAMRLAAAAVRGAIPSTRRDQARRRDGQDHRVGVPARHRRRRAASSRARSLRGLDPVHRRLYPMSRLRTTSSSISTA